MNRWQEIYAIEEQYKVRDLDSAIRELRRDFKFPWTLKKSSIKIFKDVTEYPVASDHDELAFIEESNIDAYADSARYHNTSIKEFYQQVQEQRNNIAEIWDGGTKYLGVRYKDSDLESIMLSTAEVVGDYAVSDDATAVAADTVNYKKGNGSMKITIVSSTGSASIKNTFSTAISDSSYKSKYHFAWIYLDAVPTSIEMRLQTDDSNYLATTVTTQFSGQAFKADQWNLIAQDLNTATAVGTFNSASIASQIITLTGAATGTYYLDQTDLREWKLQDYWYYSLYNVLTETATTADQEYFYNSSETYSTSSKLLGDSEWADVIMYDACMTAINEKENKTVFGLIAQKRQDAWNSLMTRYPMLKQLITTNRYRYTYDYNNE